MTRRWAVAALSGSVAVVVAVGLVGVQVRGSDSSDDQGDRGDRGDRGGRVSRTELAASPLSARYGSVGAWTGSEMVVVGGSDTAPCEGEDCDEFEPDYRRDGAAYDPGSDSWRTIADAPVPVGSYAGAAWSGREVVVLAEMGSTYAYDPVADSWRTLSPSPTRGATGSFVLTDRGLAFSVHSQLNYDDKGITDVLLDPVSGTWTRLPPDPFGSSSLRNTTWDGERLWLLSFPDDEFYAGAPYRGRLAVLEGGLADGTWRRVDDQTPELDDVDALSWLDGRLVVPSGAHGDGEVYDVAADSWTAVPRVPGASACIPQDAGAGPRWVAGGSPVLVDADGATAVLPPCPAYDQRPDVAVWAGDDLLVWGGSSQEHPTGTAVGYRFDVP